MSKKRKINGAIAIAVAVAMSASVVCVWSKMECSAWSLVAAAFWYTACTAGVWAVVDDFIKRKEEEQL